MTKVDRISIEIVLESLNASYTVDMILLSPDEHFAWYLTILQPCTSTFLRIALWLTVTTGLHDGPCPNLFREDRAPTTCPLWISVGLLGWKHAWARYSRQSTDCISYAISFYIHLHIHMCFSLALRHADCLYVHLTGRRLFYTTIVRSSRPLGNRKSGRVVRT